VCDAYYFIHVQTDFFDAFKETKMSSSRKGFRRELERVRTGSRRLFLKQTTGNTDEGNIII
jgi:hypothetical protein